MPVGMYTSYIVKGYYTYRRGVMVARFDRKGISGPQVVERATDSLHAFFVSWGKNVSNIKSGTLFGDVV